jgi:phosphoribosyl 1,2-cyclic phosphate phosphodiesterase
MNPIKKDIYFIDGKKRIHIKTIKVKHGNVDCICYIIDKKLAYISDVSHIYEKDFKYFKKLKYLVIDCLWFKDHPSHLNLAKSLELIKLFSPQKAVLTNLHTDLDYDDLKKKLPNNIIPAHDGLILEL